MSKRTVTFRQCDGCLRNDRDHGIEISDSKSRSLVADDQRTIDICTGCSAAEKYICMACRSVHDDEHLCEMLRERLANTDRPPF